MPVEFAAVVRVDDALTLADEFDKIVSAGEFVVIRAIVATPYERTRNSPRQKRVSLAICCPNFALIACCGL